MERKWYFGQVKDKSVIKAEGNRITLGNSLIERVISMDSGTVYFSDNEHKFIKTCGSDGYLIIDGQKYFLYKDIKAVSFQITSPTSKVKYVSSGNESEQMPFPPEGRALKVLFDNEFVTCEVIYEIYDGMPAISKSFDFVAKRNFTLGGYACECLTLTEHGKRYLYAESNYNGGDMLNNNRRISVKESSVDGEYVLEAGFEQDFEYDCREGEKFEGIKLYELGLSSDYYEYRTIEIKYLYRRVMPWVLDCPVFFHLISDNYFKVRRAIEDVEKVGFDMIIQSFKSGLNMQRNDWYNIAKHRRLYDYAHSKGIRIGGYTLAIVKNYLPILTDECNSYADPKTRIFRCLACEWSQKYWKKIFGFCDRTGSDLIEIDGPYHFLKCKGGRTHLHKGLNDSRYLQWKLSTVEVFAGLRQRGIYVNAPDWLYMNGNNKSGIGYEEIAFSQPRQEQLIASRIYNYKGSFAKIPSMAWSFLPMNVYHGGGRKAAFAPLEKNIKDFDWMVFQHFAAGIIPCFRGKKLFDGPESLGVLRRHTAFYKKYKYVLNGDTIHFLPPVMDPNNPCRALDIDAVLNVRHDGDCRGILAVFNQTDRRIKKTIAVPVYHTALCGTLPMPSPDCGTHICDVKHKVYGLYPPPFPVYEDESAGDIDPVSGYAPSVKLPREKYDSPDNVVETEYSVIVAEKDEFPKKHTVFSDCKIHIEIDLAPMSYTWYAIRKPSNN